MTARLPTPRRGRRRRALHSSWPARAGAGAGRAAALRVPAPPL